MSTMLVVLILVFVFSSLLLRMWDSPKAMERIPGSLGWPIVGESFSFLSEFLSPAGIFSFVYKRQQKYGKVFKTYVLGRYTIFMTGREASKTLLTGRKLTICHTNKVTNETLRRATILPWFSRKAAHNLSFLGFGSGLRMCPGINLAKLEICVFIHHLICRYKSKPLEKDDYPANISQDAKEQVPDHGQASLEQSCLQESKHWECQGTQNTFIIRAVDP